MTYIEEFYLRIEDEYKDFVKKLENYDSQSYLQQAQYIANFQNIYTYLIEKRPVDYDNFESLLYVEEPIKTICDNYNPNVRGFYEGIVEMMTNTAKAQAITEKYLMRSEAKRKIHSMIPTPDSSITANWLRFYESDSENFSDKDEEYVYDGLIESMRVVYEKHGSAILQKLYNMGEYFQVFPKDLIEHADFLAEGGDINEIPLMYKDSFYDKPYVIATESEITLC